MSSSDPAELRLDLKLYLAQSMLESVVYGCYMVTFGMAMYVMTQRKGANAASRWDFWALVLLFLIATLVTLTDLIANASILYNTFGLGGLRPDMTKAQIHHFNISMHRDGICVRKIRRCYVVWNSSFKIVAVPIFISIVNNAVGFSAVVMLIDVFVGPLSEDTANPDTALSAFNAANKMLEAFFAVNVFSNVLLTGLIAGKIWWILRALQKMTAEAEYTIANAPMVRIRERYRSTIAIIVESGLLYPVSVIVFEIILQAVPLAPSLYPLMTTLAGMAPTLIITRVQLGVSVNTLNESANVLHLTGLNREEERSTGLTSSIAYRSNNSRQFVEKDEENSIDIVSAP
ncbi:hypothetical protein D9758_009280 [Tetrapyrgos nigripes]|uniref:Uncharacterized protein n=1 Tax=Tetrapyrgos nigripes TaxID=182062 RepID=A0A8H5GHC4_9AGAR|nr:hypothetical protein D9758_009280 [Tetrapyrgos nigripes]